MMVDYRVLQKLELSPTTMVALAIETIYSIKLTHILS